jgi:hypothetical protein
MQGPLGHDQLAGLVLPGGQHDEAADTQDDVDDRPEDDDDPDADRGTSGGGLVEAGAVVDQAVGLALEQSLPGAVQAAGVDVGSAGAVGQLRPPPSWCLDTAASP